MKDYYEILGVPKNASKDEIKRAYRRLAHQYHPDKNEGDEKKFKEINGAYQVLGDDAKKSQYDQFGQTFDAQGGFGGFSAGGGPASGWDFSNFKRGAGGFEGVDFSDIFSDFFGGGARTSVKTKQRGRDIHVDAAISLEEAYKGAEREISLKKYIQCGLCRGNRNEPGTQLNYCKTCGGSGELRQTHRIAFGAFTRVVDCKECVGTGKVPEKKCSKCRGNGRLQDIESISLKIPAGISTGEVISFSGKGEMGESGAPGNLYVEVHIKPHDKFERREDDIYSQERISLSQAVLGGVIKIKTLGGENDVKIPDGMQSHDVIKLQGKGMPRLSRGGFGDHYLTIIVENPKKLSKRAKDLFEELKKEGI